MRGLSFFLTFLPFALLRGEEWPVAADLRDENYQVRRSSEDLLVTWVREEDSKARADQLFERYLQSDDPEEFIRLSNVLWEVHYEHKKDEIRQKGSGFIGIEMDNRERVFDPQRGEFVELPHAGRAVLISQVIAETPADLAGLQGGDLILAIDEELLASESPSQKLKEIVSARAPGELLTLTLEREGQQIEREVRLMNSRAVRAERALEGFDARVDWALAERLKREAYREWLAQQRIEAQAAGR
ncbi:PDZ domain-containing protein [Roseibacillus ishigakijimensis]|uniref:PDZ domain-containing protein n=1 Tax=Roseibacillus ishigakijimensis TaxID=454146 RepID=A0A934VLC5_9BACT|nr:PDZ domain-containing protein [Roseibacillus ishigakijimensis]MBK1832966.1 PDZ domain-containing protein [Roseibacillus ishigakijimensis]